MRILHVSQPTTSGLAFYVREVVRAGVDAGHEIVVACPNEGTLPVWVADAGAAWLEFPLVRKPVVSDARRVFEMRDLLREYDLVHAHSAKGGAVVRTAAVLTRTPPPIVFTPNGWSWLVGGRMTRVYQTFERLATSRTDVIVAVCAEERSAARPVLGRGLRKVWVIDNGVDPTRFAPDGPRAVPGDTPRVLCVGRLAYQKGQDVAIRALAFSTTPWVLRLLGDGDLSDRATLLALARELGVDDRVEFCGSVPDTAPELRGADVVVVPSRWDGLSFALLEAMSCARPVVATRAIGAGVLDGAGILVSNESAEELAAAVEGLLADETMRRGLGEAARARILNNFTLDNSMSQTLAIYRLLARKGTAELTKAASL